MFDRYGSPARLTIRQVPVPEPRDDEIRVRVVFTTVTRTDTATLRGHPFFARLMTGLFSPKFRVLGMDFAGEIDAVGAAVDRFRPGDRVFGLLPDRYGAHAQFVCVRADAAIARVPDGLS